MSSSILRSVIVAVAALAASGPVAAADATGGGSLLGLRCLLAPKSAGCAPATAGAAAAATAAAARTTVTPLASTLTPANGKFTVLAWNDLGMHCVDGKDYSVMSILPPYNNLHAQVISKTTGKQVTSGVTLTYESMADPSGSINTTSAYPKTNFWSYVKALYGGQPAANYGLNLSNPAISNPTPSTRPAQMKWNAGQGWFEAEGLPITPYDDAGRKNYYPMVKVVAKDSTGAVVGYTQTVLPVSDEMTCKACHASGSTTGAVPKLRGWVYDPDPEKDWKKNILRAHDDRHAGDPVYQAALAQLDPAGSALGGLANRAANGTPTLCASCHGSNALNSPGFTVKVGTQSVKISALTSAMHKMHATATDPATQVALDAGTKRDSCYLCHPGAATKCLRGAMSDTPNLDCQSCHGNMAAVGNPTRVGWLQQPNCQACHYNGLRETSAVTSVTTGAVRVVADTRFATTPNKPMVGFSLYRFSTGHGKMQCEACHGSTHAEYSGKVNTWSTSHDNDILQTRAIQGYAGTVTECKVCHATVPVTATGGPHGLHTIGQAWVDRHGDLAEGSGAAACKYCHGADYKGSPLSVTKVARSFTHDGRTYNIAAGTKIGCYTCHNGPNP